MSDLLPSITALRTLEAATRHNNFSEAAKELNITPSAVSHQIRKLEEMWALKLFERRPRQVAQTRSGQELATLVRHFLFNIKGTVKNLQDEVERKPLRINTMTSFAYKWLIPRLGTFHEKHPDIEVWISTSNKLTNLATESFDTVIRLGSGEYRGLHSTFLLGDYVFPVCSPSLAKNLKKQLKKPVDLLKQKLLYRVEDESAPTWVNWFSEAGVENPVLPMGPKFPDTNTALLAAMGDQGIALARSSLVHEELLDGRLVKLFDIILQSPINYYLVCPQGTENTPEIMAFRNWITEEGNKAQISYRGPS
jgi:LysR family transcriptional regulator, glycine cleavage system transcriptional activator